MIGALLSRLMRAPPEARARFVAQLARSGIADLEWFGNAHVAQRPPLGAWRTWVMLGGRGAGKTRAGAEWISGRAAQVERLALVGPTLHDVREVMIDGPSGLRRLPGRAAPTFQASRRRLEWPNGAVAYAFSAEDPDSLRGPQFGAAWADEFCAWAHPEATLANLRLGLRLADAAQTAVTTTPRPTAALRRLLAEPTCVRTDAPTAANAANLGAGFLDDLMALYGGTRLAAQELEGKITEAEGSLWTLAMLEGVRGDAPGRLERTVVAVDPPATAGGACGIVVAGRAGERAYVLADRTVRGLSPGGWAGRVAAAVEAWDADAVVAESNQGGEMVRSVLESAGVDVFVRLVNARWGKRARAEPVAALYEQGRVVHCGAFPALEEEMLALGGEGVLEASPDRADALVWAVTDLLLDRRWEGPRLTVL